MRRVAGTGLVRNEKKILAAALRLAVEGTVELYGYELFAQLTDWRDEHPMNHGTVYRCLRRLKERGLFDAYVSGAGRQGPPRVMYALTSDGIRLARNATVQLASEQAPPVWVDPGVAKARVRRRRTT